MFCVRSYLKASNSLDKRTTTAVESLLSLGCVTSEESCPTQWTPPSPASSISSAGTLSPPRVAQEEIVESTTVEAEKVHPISPTKQLGIVSLQIVCGHCLFCKCACLRTYIVYV